MIQACEKLYTKITCFNSILKRKRENVNVLGGTEFLEAFSKNLDEGIGRPKIKILRKIKSCTYRLWFFITLFGSFLGFSILLTQILEKENSGIH